MKQKKNLIYIELIICIGLMVILGFFAYNKLIKNSSNQTNTNSSDSSAPKKTTPPEEPSPGTN